MQYHAMFIGFLQIRFVNYILDLYNQKFLEESFSQYQPSNKWLPFLYNVHD